MVEQEKHKCYISFKTEDEYYKSEIQKMKKAGKLDYIDKSLNNAIDSEDPDYIMRKIREDYLSDSTVTIFLIGTHSMETLGREEQQFIKRELQASLFDGEKKTEMVFLELYYQRCIVRYTKVVTYVLLVVILINGFQLMIILLLKSSLLITT